jgi:hypothetical protein
VEVGRGADDDRQFRGRVVLLQVPLPFAWEGGCCHLDLKPTVGMHSE